MAYLGTLSFQANDNTDVFLVADVVTSQFYPTDNILMGYAIDELEALPEWVSGKLPKKTSVTVDGDTSVLYCTYKASVPIDFEITVYLEYEQIEELSTEVIQEDEKIEQLIL